MVRDPVCLTDLNPRNAGAVAEHQGRSYYFCSSKCQQKFIQQPEIYLHNASSMRLTVGVMGSASNESAPDIKRLAYALGEEIAKRGYVLITGACPGLPYQCAKGAMSQGGLSIGISPALSLDEHLHKYHSPSDSFDLLIYTGSGLMGREVTNIRSSDMVVIIGGRSGTLGEFAIAYDEGKLIGVLQGSGGISDKIPDIIDSFGDKDNGAHMIYDSDPHQLMTKLSKTYTELHYRKPSCFCNDSIEAAG